MKQGIDRPTLILMKPRTDHPTLGLMELRIDLPTLDLMKSRIDHPTLILGVEEPFTRVEVPGPGNILDKILLRLLMAHPDYGVSPETTAKKQVRNYPIEDGKYLPDGLGSSIPHNNKSDL
jgi:hypothetical protein